MVYYSKSKYIFNKNEFYETKFTELMEQNLLTMEFFGGLSPKLSKQNQERIAEIMVVKDYTKNDNFISLNKTDSKEYILLEGIVRSFLLNEAGEELSIAFYQNTTFLPINFTRTSQGKSLLNFQCLTASKIAAIDAKLFQELMEEVSEIQNFVTQVLRENFIQKMNREIRLASWKAKDRLVSFRREYDQLENLIPHPMIASFLGITNVSLSRLRGQ